MKIPQSIRDLLPRAPLAHLTTLNADGSPQVSVTWVGIENEEFVIGHLNLHQKIRNIRRDPRVALSTIGRTPTDFANTWSLTATANRYREFVPVCRSGMNSNRQFRFSNNLTTAGCLVRQRFDEPALLGVTEGTPGRSSRCSETITESCRPEVPEPGLAVRIHFAPPIRRRSSFSERLLSTFLGR
jgi:hypothetical protein